MRGSVKLLLVTLAVLFGKFLFWFFTDANKEEQHHVLVIFCISYFWFCVFEIILRIDYDEFSVFPEWLKYLNIITLFQFIIKQADEHV